MATEPIQALPYPEPSDAPDGPNQIKALVDAVAPLLNLEYADTTARDAAVTSPVEGMRCATGSGATMVWWRYHNGAWRGWRPATSTLVTSPVAIGTSYTVMATAPTFTADGVSRIRVSANAYGVTAASANLCTVALREDGTTIASANIVTINGTSEGVSLFRSLVPTAGNHVYTAAAASAATTPAMYGSATSPIELLVECLG